MSLSLLPSNDLIICRLVKAMYDATPGYTYLSNFKSYAADNGIDATANALADSAGFTAQNFKSTLLTNLGLADNADAGAYVDSQIASGASFGAVALASVNALATLTFTAGSALATAQATLNADVTRGLTYSLDASNTTTDLAELRAADDETGKAFVLTALTDSVTGTALGDTVTGAAGTLTSGDRIELGDGVDSLTATIGGSVTPASLTGVDTVNITATAAATVDFKNATGITSLEATGSAGNVVYDNVTTLANVVLRSATGTTDIKFKDSLLTGSDDTLNLSLDGVAGVVTIGGETDTDGDYETLIIATSGGASDLGTGAGLGADAKTLTITGAADLDLGSTASFGKLETLNAGDATGDLTIVLANRAAASETAVSFTTGAGEDTLDIGALVAAQRGDTTVNLGAADDILDIGAVRDTDTGSSYDGGDGEDTLIITTTALTAADKLRLSNFEILQIESSVTQDADNFAGTIFQTGAAALTLVIDDLADDSVVNLNHSSASVTINRKTDTASDAVVVNIGGTAGGLTASALVFDTDYETVTINSQGTAANTITAVSTNTVGNMTFTGATNLTVSDTSNISGVVDFTESTGDNTVSVTPTAAQTINFGSGDDTLTASGLLATGVTQTIRGGAGDDSLTAGAVITTGNLVLNGEAGSDTINTAALVGAAGPVISTASVNGGADIDFITLDPDTNTGQVLQDVVTTAVATADMDRIVGFTTAVDDVDFNGTLLNGSNSTVVKADDTTLAAAIVEDADATVFYVTTNLAGTAASTLTTLADATTSSTVTTAAAAFEAAFVDAIGDTAITGLDTAVSGTETVLLAYDNGVDSVLMYFTNSDTGTANTITVDEIEIVAVFDATATLAAGDVI